MSLTNLKLTSNKTVFIYENGSNRTRLLARFLQDGIDRNELCILLSPANKSDIIYDLNACGFEPKEVLRSGQFRLFKIEQTPLQDGYFAADYILHNADVYNRDAKKLGYTGFRAAGEMPWVPRYLDQSIMEPDASLIDDSSYMGLCFYPVNNELRRHPSVIYDGNIADLPTVFAT